MRKHTKFQNGIIYQSSGCVLSTRLVLVEVQVIGNGDIMDLPHATILSRFTKPLVGSGLTDTHTD